MSSILESLVNKDVIKEVNEGSKFDSVFCRYL